MPAAAIGLGIGAVGSIASGLISSHAAGKAADAQAKAAQQSLDFTKKQFAQTRADLAPWRQTGNQALGKYAGLLGVGGGPGYSPGLQQSLQQYPGYQFALSEGTDNIERRASTRGLLQSGQTLKDITAFSQGLASTNVENYLNRLQGLSGAGEHAAVQTGQFGANAAQQAGRAGERAAQSRGSGYLGQASAIGGAITGAANIAGNYFGNNPSNTNFSTPSFAGSFPAQSGYLGAQPSYSGGMPQQQFQPLQFNIPGIG